MIEPVPGMCLVIEDRVDNLSGHSALKDSGFIDATERNTGVTGIVYAVNDSPRKCLHCGQHEVEHIGIKEGDHVIYSKFVAEQIFLKDDQGKEIEGLKSVPTDAIIGFIR